MDDDGNHGGSYARNGGKRDRLPSADGLSPLSRAYRHRREHSGSITSRSSTVTDVELLAYQLQLSVREVHAAIRLGLIEWPKR